MRSSLGAAMQVPSSLQIEAECRSEAFSPGVRPSCRRRLATRGGERDHGFLYVAGSIGALTTTLRRVIRMRSSRTYRIVSACRTPALSW